MFLMEAGIMTEQEFTCNARVMAKGQVTIPKRIREILGIKAGDCVSFIAEKGTVQIINSSVYAIQKCQKQIKGISETAGLLTDEDVAASPAPFICF